MTWNPTVRPDPNICPEKYCYHWVTAGGTADLSGQTYDSIEDAIDSANNGEIFPEGGCGCCFGSCLRIDNNSETDWYEPDEPALEHDLLPWFYFISGIDKLGEDFKEEYIRESINLWREHDGLISIFD